MFVCRACYKNVQFLTGGVRVRVILQVKGANMLSNSGGT